MKQEISEMKPGRDLDIKVALEVMGYLWLKHLLQFSAELAVKWLATPTEMKESCGMYVPVPDSQFISLKERENHAESVLAFSTDMDAAEKVVTRMQELGYEYQLKTSSEQEVVTYCASFNKASQQAVGNSIGYMTVPEAIVKGALVAIHAE